MIGRSREGRPIRAFRFGRGTGRISLIAGCHADEPVGPGLLRRLCSHLASLPSDAPALARRSWWIVPHLNPDGEARNAAWQRDAADAYDLVAYLRGVVREAPGDDVEFGFPRDAADTGARPENRAVAEWWRSAGGPFLLHASLHGMAIGAGPWFLVEPAWQDRLAPLMTRCRERALELGYRLHDVDRRGEKGFHRLAPGFSTRPDSEAMRRHFEGRGDPETAALFRPSSMEHVRGQGGDPLTLVSEMPLFVVPGPDPGGDRGSGRPDLAWRNRMEEWSERLGGTDGSEESFRERAAAVRHEARTLGVRPMPVRDQWDLQWTMVRAGIELVERHARAAEAPGRAAGGGEKP